MPFRIDSKSAALLWISGRRCTRAVAAIMASKRQRTKRSCRPSINERALFGDVGGFGSSALISPATAATAESIGSTRSRLER